LKMLYLLTAADSMSTGPNAWNRAAQKCPGINRGPLYTAEQIRVIKNAKWWQSEKP